MKNSTNKINGSKHTSYLVYIDYNKDLPTIFKNIYNHFINCFKNHKLKIPTRFLEKTEIKWFTKKSILNKNNKNEFRPFFLDLFKLFNENQLK